MLNMLRRLDKIRFRGYKRDDFFDLVEFLNVLDIECSDEIFLKVLWILFWDSEELRDFVGLGIFIMVIGV